MGMVLVWAIFLTLGKVRFSFAGEVVIHKGTFEPKFQQAQPEWEAMQILEFSGCYMHFCSLFLCPFRAPRCGWNLCVVRRKTTDGSLCWGS